MNKELIEKMQQTLKIQETFIEVINFSGPQNDKEIDKLINQHKEIKRWFEKMLAETQESAYEKPGAEIMAW